MTRICKPHLMGAAVAAGALMLAGSAAAQSSANETITGTMTLFQPIVVTKTSDLSFGTLIRPQTGRGEATIDPASGNLAVTGAVGTISASSHSRAIFVVTGEGGLNFSVTTPSSFSMTQNGGQDPIEVTLTPTITGGALSGVSGAEGSATVGVGGQIQIDSATPSGAYAGSFTVTVAYN
jgi:hypothetical protein